MFSIDRTPIERRSLYTNFNNIRTSVHMHRLYFLYPVISAFLSASFMRTQIKLPQTFSIVSIMRYKCVVILLNTYLLHISFWRRFTKCRDFQETVRNALPMRNSRDSPLIIIEIGICFF